MPNPANGLQDTSTGRLVAQKGTDYAAHVADVGRQTTAHNRYISPVAETQATLGHMTWTAAEGVYAVRFKASVATGAPTAGDLIRVVFDASPVDDTSVDTQAWNWLQTATSSASADVEYFEFPYIASTAESGGWSEWFTFSRPLRRADFHYPGGTATTTEVAIHAETA